jgi:hypothetical protein
VLREPNGLIGMQMTKERLSERRRERTPGRMMERMTERMTELNLGPQDSRNNDLR